MTDQHRWDSEFLLEGIEKIKSTRGYDGAGMATMAPDASGMVRSFNRRDGPV